MPDVPVFINCRDRLTPLLDLLDYLERAGSRRIYLVDNDSSYPPLLDFYKETVHEVIALGENLGARALWKAGVLEEMNIKGPFVLSDPDTVPIEECPLDAIGYFAEILARFPLCVKAGFGLRIDDLPDHYRHKPEVVAYQSLGERREIAPRLYEMPIDTTFALYRRGAFTHTHRPAIRTGYPYLARHTTWYLDDEKLPEDEAFYRAHLERTSYSAGLNPIVTLHPAVARASGRSETPASEETPGPQALLAPGAWEKEPPLVAESLFTRSAEPGWLSWNDMSPEKAYCDFVAALVKLVRPATVIETGTGQGFLARRIKPRLGEGQRLTCYESDPQWREGLASLPFFDDDVCRLSPNPSPTDAEFAEATLALLDSDFEPRFSELEAWWRSAPGGALLVIHDVSDRHPPNSGHARLRRRIDELGIPGFLLHNPRGGFVGIKPEAPSG